MKTTVHGMTRLRWGLTLACVWMLGFWASTDAQTNKTDAADVEVVETKVNLDEAQVTNHTNEKSNESQKLGLDQMPVQEEAVVHLNKNLKNAIVENQKLNEARKDLEGQVKMLRGQIEVDHNRLNSITFQRDTMNNKIVQLEDTVKNLQQKVDSTQPAETSPTVSANSPTPVIKESTPPSAFEISQPSPEQLLGGESANVAPEAMRMLTKIDGLYHENEQLKLDAAKVHYNMGNIYFQKGDYVKAQAEYLQAVDFMPYDAFAHFNLAFVSGEFLDDPQTALTHYQRYLYFNPKADDAELVKEKILAAQLKMRTRIESPIDPEAENARKAAARIKGK